MSPLISFVVACHGESRELPVLVGSLQTQRRYAVGRCTRTGNEVHRVCTGERETTPIEIVLTSDGAFGGDRRMLQDARVRLIECPAGTGGAAGHGTREVGIDHARGEWIVLTNGDNYFVGGFLDRIVTELRYGVGMATWDCVNNLWRWGTQGGSRLDRGKIDLSSAIVRSDIAKQVGFHGREYDSDFDYIFDCGREANRRGLRIASIDETLVVHN